MLGIYGGIVGNKLKVVRGSFAVLNAEEFF
jgi:hypothetical protein